MGSVHSIENYNGPSTNLSGSSTVVTNIEASLDRTHPPPKDTVISVSTSHTQEYEPVPKLPPKYLRRMSIKSMPLDRVVSNLDEVLESEFEREPVSPRIAVQLNNIGDLKL